jgi:hypothetical protein
MASLAVSNWEQREFSNVTRGMRAVSISFQMFVIPQNPQGHRDSK